MKTKTRQEFHWIMIGSVTDLVMVRKKPYQFSGFTYWDIIRMIWFLESLKMR